MNKRRLVAATASGHGAAMRAALAAGLALLASCGRHPLRQCRGRAFGHGQSAEPEQHRRLVAAGSMVERRLARHRRCQLLRWRCDVVDQASALLALRRWKCGQRRRLRSRIGSMDQLRDRRQRLSARADVHRHDLRRGVADSVAGRAFEQWRSDVGRDHDADSRRCGLFQRQGFDHRGPARRTLRLCDMGSAGRSRRRSDDACAQHRHGLTWSAPAAIYGPMA